MRRIAGSVFLILALLLYMGTDEVSAFCIDMEMYTCVYLDPLDPPVYYANSWPCGGYYQYLFFGYDPPLKECTDLGYESLRHYYCCPGTTWEGVLPPEQNLGFNSGTCPVGNPTNVATGNKYESVLDLSISSSGIPLEFRRAYNNQSNDDGTGPLGYRWTHNFNLRVEVVETSPKKVKIWDSDGRALYFTERSSGSEIIFYGESGIKDRLKQVVSSGQYYLRRKGGNLTYTFSSESSGGKLLEISDPNGNTLALTYTNGLLTEIANNFEKSLTLGYTNNRITSVTDPQNQSISFDYTNGDLTKVTYPDTKFVRYAYSSHLLTDKYDTNDNTGLFGHWGYDSYGIKVTNYYSHIKDGVPQEEINLTYPFGKTELRRTIGGQTYLTTYTTGVIDRNESGESSRGLLHLRRRQQELSAQRLP